MVADICVWVLTRNQIVMGKIWVVMSNTHKTLLWDTIWGYIHMLNASNISQYPIVYCNMVYWFDFNATNISNDKTPKNCYIEWQTDTMKRKSRGTAFVLYFWERVQYGVYMICPPCDLFCGYTICPPYDLFCGYMICSPCDQFCGYTRCPPYDLICGYMICPPCDLFFGYMICPPCDLFCGYMIFPPCDLFCGYMICPPSDLFCG